MLVDTVGHIKGEDIQIAKRKKRERQIWTKYVFHDVFYWFII